MALFRSEALRAQDRLHGEVNLAPPVTWQLLGYFIAGSVAVVAVFLSIASYGKVTVVPGRIASDRGVVRAVASRSGGVDRILVVEGQHVHAGDPLARISLDTASDGTSLEARRAQALAERDRILGGSRSEMAAVTRSRIDALTAEIAGDRDEIASLQQQMSTQADLVRNAQDDLSRISDIAAKGYISGHEVMLRQEHLDEHRQAMQKLEQQLATKRSAVGEAEAQIAQARADLAVQTTQIAGQRADLKGQAAADANTRSVLVVAGADGVVTGITAHVGDRVDASTTLMSVVPRDARLQAEIDVPADAAGLIAPGQPVRIAVDAYPYETFGSVDAVIRTISRATVPVRHPDGTQDQVFVVQAPLKTSTIHAFGAARDLLPGMTVTARITTRKRSLMSLLFEPMVAVSKR